MARKIEVQLVGDSRSLERAFGRAEGSGKKWGAALGRTAKLGALGLAAAAGTAAIASTKLALDFESSMSQIRALVGASDAQMDEYKTGVLDLAKTVPQGPKALADALYFVTSAGFAGKEALDVLDASARAAAAGLGETKTVADAVTSAVNAYGISNLRAERATDILLATVREGKAEPEELAAAIGRVIAPAEAMGVEFGEVGGAVAALSLTGLDAAEAVTGLRGVLASLLKPSQQATAFLEENGLSMKKLREQVAQKGLLKTMQSLRDRFGDNKEALAKLFPNVRALNAFLSLTGANAKKNAKVMKEVAGATGDTSEAFAKASEYAQFRLSVAWSKIQVAMIEFGSKVLPIVVAAVEKTLPLIERLIAWLRPLGPEFRRVSVFAREQFARLVAYWNGTLLPAIRNIIAFARRFWAKFGDDIRRNLQTAITIIRAMLNVIKGIVEFVMALIRGDWSAAWKALKDIARNVLAGIVAMIRGFVGNVFAAAKGLGTAIKDGIVAGARALGSALASVVKGAINAVLGSIRAFGIPPIKIDPPGPGSITIPGIHPFAGIPNVHTGGDITRTGLAMLQRGERVQSARVANRGGGAGQFALVYAGADFIGWLQEQDKRHRRGNGGRGIL